MPRVDIWDVQQAQDLPPVELGFPRDLNASYECGSDLGKGGFGTVSVVTERRTGERLACKRICKRLDIPNLSADKQKQHIDNIRREVAVLRKLRGTLNVAHLRGVYEDERDVHILMELCTGGELSAFIKQRAGHYSEQTAASFLRAILRTLVQCHSHRILHRDIKPGNFLLLSSEENAPLKAIDFGLAAFFDPDNLPRTDLGLEGTPWFMAPEVLSSETWPASDVWAVGVLAHQLLSGQMPFDDRTSKGGPALSRIWKAILTEEPAMRGAAWQGMSEPAKDFVRTLLNKDPRKRPTARQALQHAWLQASADGDRWKGRPLDATVVQRIQRFAQGNVLKRTIFELIAEELIKAMPSPRAGGSLHGGSVSGGGSVHNGAQQHANGSPASEPQPVRKRKHERELGQPGAQQQGEELDGDEPGADGHPGARSLPRYVPSNVQPLDNAQPPLTAYRPGMSAHGGLEYARLHGMTSPIASGYQGREAASVHGGTGYWRLMRAAAQQRRAGSVHGGSGYLRTVSRSDSEREEHRKAARLALDTSRHDGREYTDLLQDVMLAGAADGSSSVPARPGRQQQASDGRGLPRPGAQQAAAAAQQASKRVVPPAGSPQLAAAPQQPDAPDEVAQRGQFAYRDYLQRMSGDGSQQPQLPGDAASGPPPGRGAGSPGLPQASAFAQAPDRGRAPQPRHAERLPGQQEVLQQQQPRQQQQQQSPPSPALPPIDEAASVSVVLLENLTGAGVRHRQRQQQQALQSPQVREHQLPPPSDFAGGPLRPAAPGALGKLPRTPSQARLTPQGLEVVDVDGGRRTIPLDAVQGMVRKLFSREDHIDADQLADRLRRLGYELAPGEAAALAAQVDPGREGRISKPAFIASQLDWQSFQQNYKDQWLECAQRAFAGLDSDTRGLIGSADLVRALSSKLPAHEVEFAVEDALVDAGYADADDIDFEGFLKLMRVDSMDSLDSLDAYESRMGPRRASGGGSNPDTPDSSLHGADNFQPLLAPVTEEQHGSAPS